MVRWTWRGIAIAFFVSSQQSQLSVDEGRLPVSERRAKSGRFTEICRLAVETSGSRRYSPWRSRDQTAPSC